MSLDIQGLMEDAERLSKENNSSDFLENFVKFPSDGGVVVVRLLGPASPGMFDNKTNPFYQSTRIHRVNGKSLHCLKTLNNNKWEGDCPICLYYNWLWKESETKDPAEAEKLQNQARAIKPIERYYFNCIVRKEVDEKTNEVRENVGPKILSIGKTLLKKIITGIVGDKEMEEPALGDVTDFKTGRDFKIIKTIRQSHGRSFPNYDQSKFLEPSPVDPDLAKKCMENLHNLVTLRHPPETEEAKLELKKHLGLIPDTEGTSFDPTEFQTDTSTSVSVEKDVPSEKTEAPVSESKVESSTAVEELEDDDDFINKLREIG
ncbi:MAG: hypothetical protein DWQ19_11115 [Crenarchaeota archaeon]|nr:MAG: hypothetical protein DWQ19_11115 [Thermoproteota archaeon]